MSTGGVLDQPPEEYTYEDARARLNQNLLNLALVGAVMGANAYRRGAFETQNKQFTSASAAASKTNKGSKYGLGLYQGPGKNVSTSGSSKSISSLKPSKSMKAASEKTLYTKSEPALSKAISTKTSVNAGSVAKSLPTLSSTKASLKSLRMNTKTKGDVGRKVRAAINKVDNALLAGKLAVQAKTRPMIKAAAQKINKAKVAAKSAIRRASGTTGTTPFQAAAQKINKATAAAKSAVRDLRTSGTTPFREELAKKTSKAAKQRDWNVREKTAKDTFAAMQASKAKDAAKSEAWKNKMVKRMKTYANTQKLGPVATISKARSAVNLNTLPKMSRSFGSTPMISK